MAVEQSSQLDHLANMPTQTIPHGCDIPISLFRRYIKPRGALLELGAGVGRKAQSLRREIFEQNVPTDPSHYSVIAVDINKAALAEARGKTDLFFSVNDVRQVEGDGLLDQGLAYFSVETYMGGVYMEGLLCNLRDEDWKRVIAVADILLPPRSYLLIADNARIETENPYLEGQFVSTAKLHRYQEKWTKRYRQNIKAAELLGVPLTDGEFMVAKPGPNKEIEWGDADDLVELYSSDQFERFAQHLNTDELRSFLWHMGFGQVEYRQSVFYSSRTHTPLNGFVGVWRKGERYKYHPWYKGLTWEERDPELRPNKYQSDYYQIYFRRLLENLRDLPGKPEDYFPSLADRSWWDRSQYDEQALSEYLKTI